MYHWLSASALGLMVVIATVCDIRRGEIPGPLTIGGVLAGVLASLVAQGSVATSLAGAALGAGLLIGFVWLGGMGAGDAWLMAAIGAWSSWHFVLSAALWASLAGGLMAAGAAITCPRGRPWRQRVYPYVPAIAVGTAIAWFVR